MLSLSVPRHVPSPSAKTSPLVSSIARDARLSTARSCIYAACVRQSSTHRHHKENPTQGVAGTIFSFLLLTEKERREANIQAKDFPFDHLQSRIRRRYGRILSIDPECSTERHVEIRYEEAVK